MEVEITLLTPKVECPDHECREELINLMNAIEKNHVTHKGMMAWIGVPIGVIGIIIGLIMTLISTNYGSLQQNLIVSKQRNDYQDQRITLTELADANIRGDIAVIKEKISSIDKRLSVMSDTINRMESKR